MRAIVVIIVLTILLVIAGCSTAESDGKKYCANKGGVEGWSKRYGFVVVHCKDGSVKALQ